MAAPSLALAVGRGAGRRASTMLTAAKAAEPAVRPVPPEDGTVADPPRRAAADGAAAADPPAREHGTVADPPPRAAVESAAPAASPAREVGDGGGDGGGDGLGSCDRPPRPAADGAVRGPVLAEGPGGVAGAPSTAARRAVAVSDPVIRAVARVIGIWCVRRRTPSTTGRPGPLATCERWIRAVDAAGPRGAAADADGRRAALLKGRSETPSRTLLWPKVAATDDGPSSAGDGSPDGPAGAPGAGGPTR